MRAACRSSTYFRTFFSTKIEYYKKRAQVLCCFYKYFCVIFLTNFSELKSASFCTRKISIKIADFCAPFIQRIYQNNRISFKTTFCPIRTTRTSKIWLLTPPINMITKGVNMPPKKSSFFIGVPMLCRLT